MLRSAGVLAVIFTILSFCLSDGSRPRVLCDPRTLPPKAPSFQACSRFLERLGDLSRTEPQGAYKWWGRHIDPCSECNKLPTHLYFSGLTCSAIIDVFDKDDDSLSIFGMDDLQRALSTMVGKCWLGDGVFAKRHNGVGFPGSQSAYAGLVKAPDQAATEGPGKINTDNMTMMDLNDGGNARGGHRGDFRASA